MKLKSPAEDKDSRLSRFCTVGLRLTSLDAGGVVELVAGGTLALQLSIGHGNSRGTVRADAGVSVAGLRQTQQGARLVGTGIMAWGTREQDLSSSIKGKLCRFPASFHNMDSTCKRTVNFCTPTDLLVKGLYESFGGLASFRQRKVFVFNLCLKLKVFPGIIAH